MCPGEYDEPRPFRQYAPLDHVVRHLTMWQNDRAQEGDDKSDTSVVILTSSPVREVEDDHAIIEDLDAGKPIEAEGAPESRIKEGAQPDVEDPSMPLPPRAAERAREPPLAEHSAAVTSRTTRWTRTCSRSRSRTRSGCTQFACRRHTAPSAASTSGPRPGTKTPPPVHVQRTRVARRSELSAWPGADPTGLPTGGEVAGAVEGEEAEVGRDACARPRQRTKAQWTRRRMSHLTTNEETAAMTDYEHVSRHSKPRTLNCVR